MQKIWSFVLCVSIVMLTDPKFSIDLITFMKEILRVKPYFLCISKTNKTTFHHISLRN